MALVFGLRDARDATRDAGDMSMGYPYPCPSRLTSCREGVEFARTARGLRLPPPSKRAPGSMPRSGSYPRGCPSQTMRSGIQTPGSGSQLDGCQSRGLQLQHMHPPNPVLGVSEPLQSPLQCIPHTVNGVQYSLGSDSLEPP